MVLIQSFPQLFEKYFKFCFRWINQINLHTGGGRSCYHKENPKIIFFDTTWKLYLN